MGRSLHEEAFGAFVHAGARILVLIRAAKSQDAPRVFPRERPENGLQAAVEYVQGSHVIIDAMTGIGRKRAHCVASQAPSLPPWDSMANFPTGPALPNNEPSSALPLVVAIDTPSGVGRK